MARRPQRRARNPSVPRTPALRRNSRRNWTTGDSIPPRLSTAAVTQHAVVLLADLLSLRGYLEAAFTEVARRETL